MYDGLTLIMGIFFFVCQRHFLPINLVISLVDCAPCNNHLCQLHVIIKCYKTIVLLTSHTYSYIS